MDKRIKRLLALLSCLALLVPVAVGHGAIGAYATEDGVAVIETATPAPETAATPVPETEATPVPETEATPVPETEATPAPEAAATPVPETADTPAPGAEDTPIPDMEAGAEAAPDVAALYDALMAADTEEAFYALADGLDEATTEAFVAALTGQQQEALLSRLASLAGHTTAATVPYTRAAPFLPAVAVAVARRSAALRETGGDDNGLELFKSAVDNGDGTYTVTLEAYTTGKVIDTTITTPVDIVLVLDQSGSMSDPFVSGMTRQSAMKSAVGNFIDAVREKYDAATADHRIAIVTFGSTASTLRGWTNVDAGGARELKSAIDSLGNPYNQSTNVAAGMDRAEMLMGENYGYTGSNTMRQKVVIVFTDGMPTTQSAFSTGVANSALATSNRIKQSGVTVYAIGIFSGADPGQTYGDEGFDENSDGTVGSHWANASLNTDAADVPAGNRFLNYLSSNASGVTSIGLTEYARQQGAGFFVRFYRGWEIEQAPALAHSGYYLAASNTGELEGIFQSIGGQISTPAIELGGETVVRDLLSEYFVLPAGTGPDDIRLYTAAYDGAAFGAREEAQGLTAVVDAAAGTVSVTGFDFNENFVSDEARGECFYGRKLIVEFVVQPRDGFLGGNGVPTNDAASGVYANAGAAQAIEAFPLPAVDVPIPAVVVTATPADVYLLGGLTGEELLRRVTATAGGVSLDPAPEAENFGLAPWQNAFVDVSATIAPPGGLTGLTEDGAYTATVVVAPKTLGTAVVSEGSDRAAVRVFRPVLTFRDSTIFLGERADYADNLVSTAWKHGGEAADEAAMGMPPALTLGYDPPAGAFVRDTDVAVAAGIGGRDVTADTTMINTGDGAADHRFTVYVKACSLTIRKTGAADAGDSFLFAVTNGAGFSMTVVIHGNGSVTIRNLPVGTYTVTEDGDWSWRYEAGRTGEATLTRACPDGMVVIANRLEDDQWLGGDCYCTNVYTDEA